MGVPAHVPFVHVSFVVQYLPSLQVAPSFAGDFTQPWRGSHLPTLQRSFSAEQLMGEPVQAPSWHVVAVEHLSVGVHGSPSFANAVPHAPPTHVAVTQLFCEAGQSLGTRHATQLPFPSHTFPPPLEHGVPCRRLAVPQHPFVQVLTEQVSAGAGQSAGLVHTGAPTQKPPVPPLLVPLAVPLLVPLAVPLAVPLPVPVPLAVPPSVLPPSRTTKGPPVVAPHPGARASAEQETPSTKTTPREAA
jgi:hypothetical protein